MGYLLISDFSKLDEILMIFVEKSSFSKKGQDDFGSYLGLIGA